MTVFAPAVLGHQRPRIMHLPSWGPRLDLGVKGDVIPPELGSLGREIVDLAELAGLTLDPWQAWIMEQAHVVRPDMTYWNDYSWRRECLWAAKEVGVMVSRQNGKGSILEARELAGLFLFGERLIIHSAHQFDTSKEAFERILTLIEGTPDLEAEVKRVSRSHGEEGVELKNGQRLRFRTRTKGGGRGFTADCLILDEAMYLGAAQISALMPTLSARPNPQIWVTGSAGDKESTHFGRMRSRAMKGDDPRLFWAEWSIDGCNEFCHPDCEDHDAEASPESYAKANPGLGIRISVEHVESERRSMDPDSFRQERLGVGDWPVEGDGWLVIPRDKWMARIDHTSDIKGKFVLGVDTGIDGDYSAISACGENERGQSHVEITSADEMYHVRPGIQWVVEEVLRIWKAQKPLAVVIDKTSLAGSFIPELEAAGVKILTPNTREYAQGCGEFKNAVVPRKGEEPQLVHIDQPPLNAAVSGADVRQTSDLWAWGRRASSVNIAPLAASTLAYWGWKQMSTKKTGFAMVAYR